jgi:hypothetical protein
MELKREVNFRTIKRPSPGGAAMGYKRTVADQARDIRAMGFARDGLSYDQIATEMGYADRSGAFRAVQRGIRDAFREEATELVAMEAERLNALRRLFEEIAATKHVMVSMHSGKIVMDPEDGETPLPDYGPRMQAGLALLRVSESWRKLKGLDAPTSKRVETIGPDTVEAEIKRLEAEMKARDDADHQSAP